MSSRQAHPKLARKTSFLCTGKYNHLGYAVDTTFFVCSLNFGDPTKRKVSQNSILVKESACR